MLQSLRHLAYHGLGTRLHGSRVTPCVALTFDDGPGEQTAALLEVLAELGERATFFMVGSSVSAQTSQVRRLVSAGHEVGTHGQHHRDMSAAGRRGSRELRNAKHVLTAATGVEPRFFRPPYGRFSLRLVAGARALGLQTVLWDVDPADWRGQDAGATRLAVARSVQAGSIVLLHERPYAGPSSGAETVQALPGIVDDLRDMGYRLVTCSELFASPGRDRR